MLTVHCVCARWVDLLVAGLAAVVLIGKLARDEHFDHDLQVVGNVHKFVAQGGKNDAAYAGTAQCWIERIWVVLRTLAQRRAMGRSNAESRVRDGQNCVAYSRHAITPLNRFASIPMGALPYHFRQHVEQIHLCRKFHAFDFHASDLFPLQNSS